MRQRICAGSAKRVEPCIPILLQLSRWTRAPTTEGERQSNQDDRRKLNRGEPGRTYPAESLGHSTRAKTDEFRWAQCASGSYVNFARVGLVVPKGSRLRIERCVVDGRQVDDTFTLRHQHPGEPLGATDGAFIVGELSRLRRIEDLHTIDPRLDGWRQGLDVSCARYFDHERDRIANGSPFRHHHRCDREVADGAVEGGL